MQQYAERGWLKLPGVIPQIMVDAARRAINAHIGKNGIHPDRLPKFRAESYCRELTRHHAPLSNRLRDID